MALLASRKKSSLMDYRSLYENLYSYRAPMTTNDQPHLSTKVARFLSTSLSEQLLVPSSLLRHIVLCRIAYRNSSRPFDDQIEELRTALVTIEAQQHPECTATLLRTMLSLLQLKKIDQEIKSRSRRVVRSPCLLPEWMPSRAREQAVVSQKCAGSERTLKRFNFDRLITALRNT